MVTSRDVARIAGVSQATVSRAMRAGSEISASTRAKVLAAMDQVGYIPHAGAQAMKTNRTGTIGVVVADLNNPFYPEMLDELTRVLDSAGFRVVVWNSDNTGHKDALKSIGESAVDGVVFTTATKNSDELRAASNSHTPIVLINRTVDDLQCDRVTSDNLHGGGNVADFLVDNGRTRPAFFGGDIRASTSRDREAGFLRRMEERGFPLPEHLRVNTDFSHDRGEHEARRLLSQTPRPDAIFCANDFVALGVLDACHDLDVSPEECWVVGYDDITMAAWPSFSLTTVRQPSRVMAATGAKLLLERIKNPDAPLQDIQFPSTLVVRGSTPA